MSVEKAKMRYGLWKRTHSFGSNQRLQVRTSSSDESLTDTYPHRRISRPFCSFISHTIHIVQTSHLKLEVNVYCHPDLLNKLNGWLKSEKYEQYGDSGARWTRYQYWWVTCTCSSKGLIDSGAPMMRTIWVLYGITTVVVGLRLFTQWKVTR